LTNDIALLMPEGQLELWQMGTKIMS